MDTKTAKDILTEAGLNVNPWGIRVIEAEEYESFTGEDKDDASSWQTCACSSLQGIARGDGISDAAPSDKILHRLGMDFAEHVSEDNVVAAAWTLRSIHTRAKELQRPALS